MIYIVHLLYSRIRRLYLEESRPFGRPEGHAGCGPSGDSQAVTDCRHSHKLDKFCKIVHHALKFVGIIYILHKLIIDSA